MAAAGAGPFDSHVGTLALANLVVAAVADRMRSSATERFDRAESAWRSAKALTEAAVALAENTEALTELTRRKQ